MSHGLMLILGSVKSGKKGLEALSKMIVSSLPLQDKLIEIITEMSASRWYRISQQWYTFVADAPIYA